IADGLRALGHDVVFLGFHRHGDPLPQGVPTHHVDVRPIEFAATGVIRRAAWTMAALGRNEPLSVAKYRGGVGARVFPDLFSGFDFVLVDKVQLAWIFRDRLAGIPHSVVWHAIEHRTYGQVAEMSGTLGARVYRREASLLEEIERRLSTTTPHVFALTDADAVTLAMLGRRGPVDVLPLTVPLSLADPPDECARDVGLLGAWTWSANATGLGWFLDAVLPRLPSDWRVDVGGHGSTIVRPDVVGARRLGFVDDAKAFLGAARVVAIPLVGGTGVSMKLVEAAAQGWPTVTTPVGVRGIERLPPSVRIAETPDAFAAALAEMRAVPAETRASWRAIGRDWYRDRRNDLLDCLGAGVAACLRETGSTGTDGEGGKRW
ncbi:MAG: glycosyltransferase, partial [Phyllobacteriaceae bacterium]|nr:glycosyltransferase [Phyllobacteriaceae bacterium]